MNALGKQSVGFRFKNGMIVFKKGMNASVDRTQMTRTARTDVED